MPTLLARLGLRAGEVASLTLEDIGWRAGEITIVGKGSRRERLPLPDDAGEAIAGYLHRGRPDPFDGARRVFLRARAPHRGLTTAGVSQAAGNPLALVELPKPCTGLPAARGLPPSLLPLTARLERASASFEAEPDLAERAKEILSAELGH
jgi:integrase